MSRREQIEWKINREDMLALTRRMTVRRSSLHRVAGAYVDQEGGIEGTFNTRFLKLSAGDKEKNLALAKQIPFAKTNQQLKRFVLPETAANQNSIWRLLAGVKEAGLENDALLDVFYDLFAEQFQWNRSYGIFFFHDVYDIPSKAADHERLGESEQIFSYLICAVCPVTGEYEPDVPIWGFLYPAFAEGSAAVNCVDIYQERDSEFLKKLTQWLLDS